MSNYDLSLSIETLKKSCKKLGLPVYGRKKDLIARLKKHTNDLSSEEDQPD